VADRKITDLTALTTPASADVLPIVDVSEAAAADKNKKITVGELLRGAPNGTAAAPSFAFESDGGNGMFLGGTDILAFSTGGSQAVTIDSTGNVGIGNTNPGNTFEVRSATSSDGGIRVNEIADSYHDILSSDGNLYIHADAKGDNGSDNVLRFGVGSAGERARIDSSGRLLVGTTTALNIGGSAGTAAIQTSATTTACHISLSRFSANNSAPFLEFGKSRGASVGTQTIAANSDQIGTLQFSASDGVAFIEAARIRAEVDGTPGTNDMPGRLVFSTTADGASSPTERLRITSAGRVGIGNIAPSGFIHIQGTSTGTETYGRFTTGSASGDQSLVIKSGSSRDHMAIQVSTNAGAADDLALQPDGGNVGIGTTSPGALLTIRDAAPAIRLTADANDITELQFGDTGDEVRGNIVFRNGTGGNALCFHTNNNNERVRIDSSGRLLVGTSSSFNTAYAGATQNVQIQSTGANYANLSVIGNKNNTTGAYFALVSSRSETAGGKTAVQNNDEISRITFEGADGTNYLRAAEIACLVDGTPGTNDMPGRLVFATTADGASTPTERLRIESGGKTKFSGGAYGIERTATAAAFDLNTGNFWTCGAIAIPNPTNQVAGMMGSLRVTAAPTSFAANWKHPGGTYTAPTTFPAVAPFYVQASGTILLGSWTEGIA
jgi:hypothetical protein